MFYDSNNIQLSTKVDEVTHEDTAKKYEAWGWQVITIDGNDAAEIRQALKVAQEEKERPTLIIGHTLMGKGAVGANEEDFSNKVSTHGQPLSAAGASFENTAANLRIHSLSSRMYRNIMRRYWKRNGLRPNRKKPNKLPGIKPTRN